MPPRAGRWVPADVEPSQLLPVIAREAMLCVYCSSEYSALATEGALLGDDPQRVPIPLTVLELIATKIARLVCLQVVEELQASGALSNTTTTTTTKVHPSPQVDALLLDTTVPKISSEPSDEGGPPSPWKTYFSLSRNNTAKRADPISLLRSAVTSFTLSRPRSSTLPSNPTETLQRVATPSPKVYKRQDVIDRVQPALQTLLETQLDKVVREAMAAPVDKRRYAADGASLKGWKSKNEDRIVVRTYLNELLGPEHRPLSFYAVYDGHAGEVTSEYVATHLHWVVAQQPGFPSNAENAFKEAFGTVNSKLKAAMEAGDCRVKSGSTAVVAALADNQLHVAWVGDSVAILFNEDGTSEKLIVEHTGHNEDEKQRCVAEGGEFLRDGRSIRLNGLLSVTRSFGDYHIPQVTATPQTRSITLTGKEKYLLLASDGLTDVMSNKDIHEWLRKREHGYFEENVQDDNNGWGRRTSSLAEPTQSLDNAESEISAGSNAVTVDILTTGVAEVLAQKALDIGSTDNVSVILVKLKP